MYHFFNLSQAFYQLFLFSQTGEDNFYLLYILGVWIDSNHEVMYALASKITFICQMDFNAFPVDIQVKLVEKVNQRQPATNDLLLDDK